MAPYDNKTLYYKVGEEIVGFNKIKLICSKVLYQ